MEALLLVRSLRFCYVLTCTRLAGCMVEMYSRFPSLQGKLYHLYLATAAQTISCLMVP